jgi:hypothetical protein
MAGDLPSGRGSREASIEQMIFSGVTRRDRRAHRWQTLFDDQPLDCFPRRVGALTHQNLIKGYLPEPRPSPLAPCPVEWYIGVGLMG